MWIESKRTLFATNILSAAFWLTLFIYFFQHHLEQTVECSESAFKKDHAYNNL